MPTVHGNVDRLGVLGVAVAALVGCAGGGAPAGGSNSGASVGTTVGLGDSAGSSGESDQTSSPTASSGENTTNTDVTATTDDASESTDGGTCETTTWYLDLDGDGRGDPAVTFDACEPPPNHVPFGDDCDDTDPARNPSAAELCDGVDNDCDEAIDEASATNTQCQGCTLFAAPARSYAFCPTGDTWDGARTHCGVFGGDLLRLDDEAENAAVAALAEPPSGIGGGWFIGLSDLGARGTFVWIDGGALTFAAWLPGEPNDAEANEDCAEMDQAGGGWNDIPCATTRAFICETATP